MDPNPDIEPTTINPPSTGSIEGGPTTINYPLTGSVDGEPTIINSPSTGSIDGGPTTINSPSTGSIEGEPATINSPSTEPVEERPTIINSPSTEPVEENNQRYRENSHTLIEIIIDGINVIADKFLIIFDTVRGLHLFIIFTILDIVVLVLKWNHDCNPEIKIWILTDLVLGVIGQLIAYKLEECRE